MDQDSFISHALGVLEENEQETVRLLGEEDAHVFTDIWNDWLEISVAIRASYRKEELDHSLVYAWLHTLSKELWWFQILFLASNYPLLGARLRFVWEMIHRAF